MNYLSKLALATAIIAIATPAAAQRMPVGGSSSNKQAVKGAKPQMDDEVKDDGATSTTGRKLTVSKEAQKAILALQTAVNAKETATIPALVTAAMKVAKTSDDKFIIGSNQARAGLAANDLVGLKAGLDLMAASGSGDNSTLSMNYADLGKRLVAAGRTAEGVASFDKAIALDANNAPALALLADQKSKAGDKAGAVALMQRSFLASKTSGAKVAEGNYKFAANLAFESKLAAANDIAREWAGAYPSPESWRGAVTIYRGINQPRGQQLADMYRLARAANGLKGEADYHGYMSTLVGIGALSEAKAVLAEAASAPNIDMTKTQFKEIAAKTAKAPTRAAIDAQAKAAATPAAMIAAGDALYGVGAYAEAAAQYRAALAKGGDGDLANLHLGMALARSGDKAGAATALVAVGGNQAAIAKYWLMYVGG
ncbi:MAG: hypothetical protein ABI667_01935 [Sphingomicrobium sp.]